MYDCLQDSCSDFSFAVYDAVGRKRPLQGSLTATTLSNTPASALRELQSFCTQLGYAGTLDGALLTVNAISLADALAVNRRFGNELIISCDLRRDTPVRF